MKVCSVGHNLWAVLVTGRGADRVERCPHCGAELTSKTSDGDVDEGQGDEGEADQKEVHVR